MTIQLTIGGTTARSKAGQMPVEVDFEALPEASKSFLIRYGIKQYLADGAAGAKSNEELKSGVSERLTKLLEGTVTTRTTSEKGPSDDVETVAKRLIRADVQTLAKANKLKFSKEKVSELVEKMWANEAKQADYCSQARADIAARKARAEDFLAMDDMDILAELGLESDDAGDEIPDQD